MSESAEEIIARLKEENVELRREIARLKQEVGEDASTATHRRVQPLEGMMKLLKTKNRQIQETVKKLEEMNLRLKQSYEQTVKYYKNTITALASAMEAKDPYFNFHSSNVESVCRKIAEGIGLGHKEREQLSTAALIHDFGNIGIRAEVLHKQGPLTKEEYEHVKTHPLVASIILEPIGDFDVIIDAVKHHHENFDGTGYPDGLSGEDIPLLARILYIAESYDAVTSPRPYREPLPPDKGREEIAAYSGSRYDPRLVEAFLQVPL